MRKNVLKILVILFGISSCINENDSKEDIEKQRTCEDYQKKVDSLNLIVSDIKSNSHFNSQYRYLIKEIDTKELVAGDEFSSNGIYCVEIAYGMGLVDYIYIWYDIDDVPIIVSCVKTSVGMGNQLEYEILDRNENRIEYFFKEDVKNELQFGLKMERKLELAKEKAIKLAKSSIQ
jgi:hypothetical protein